MRDTKPIRRLLLAWYERSARVLPWRETRDPYRVWVSEIMLQQTRVTAVIPYYRIFLDRFPTVGSLARGSEEQVLRIWSGLGYYSRARNMRKAAAEIVKLGGFPREYTSIRKLPGVGDYTGAAIASIAFDLPYAVLDGNALRVYSRLTGESGDIGSATTRRRLLDVAEDLLDRERPGQFNQAVMELGATLCLPVDPKCLLCPVARSCQARRLNRQNELPVKAQRNRSIRETRTLLLIERGDAVLLWKRVKGSRLRGFWELPEADQLPQAGGLEAIRCFRHSITNHNYEFKVVRARVSDLPKGFRWVRKSRLAALPLSTVAKKALGKDTRSKVHTRETVRSS